MCFNTPTYSSYSFSHFQYYGSQLTVLYTSTTPHPIASHSEVIQFLNLVSTDRIILKGHPRPERQHRWISLPPSVNTLSHVQFFQWRVGRCQDSHMKTWGILTERDLHQRGSFLPSDGKKISCPPAQNPLSTINFLSWVIFHVKLNQMIH